MKRLTSLAVAVAVVIGGASTAWAGQEIYVGVVGDDYKMNRYYLEGKLWRWLHREWTEGQEYFDGSTNLSNNAEVCIAPRICGRDEEGCEIDLIEESIMPITKLEPNKHLPVFNAGSYTWRINLPKKPRGNINIQLQCGVLKPNAYEVLGMPNAIDTCAGETGEDTFGLCDRVFTEPNTNHIMQNYLPTVTAVAYPSMGTPFNLTAYRVPSAFSNIYNADKTALRDDTRNLEVLDGDKTSRIVLKSCQPETIFVKMPITGQVNGIGQVETDLEAGDEIQVTLDFPRGHTMDVYCNQWSAKIMGLGDPSTEDDVEAGL
jgi:hypothetical protein